MAALCCLTFVIAVVIAEVYERGLEKLILHEVSSEGDIVSAEQHVEMKIATHLKLAACFLKTGEPRCVSTIDNFFSLPKKT